MKKEKMPLYAALLLAERRTSDENTDDAEEFASAEDWYTTVGWRVINNAVSEAEGREVGDLPLRNIASIPQTISDTDLYAVLRQDVRNVSLLNGVLFYNTAA